MLKNTLSHERGEGKHEYFMSAWLTSVKQIGDYENVVFRTAEKEMHGETFTIHIDSITAQYLGFKEFSYCVESENDIVRIAGIDNICVRDMVIPAGYYPPFTGTFEQFMHSPQMRLVPRKK